MGTSFDLPPQGRSDEQGTVASGRHVVAGAGKPALEPRELRLAMRLREKWMRLMGVPEDEIRELLTPDAHPPLDPDFELEQLAAAAKLAKHAPSYEELLAWTRQPGAAGGK